MILPTTTALLILALQEQENKKAKKVMENEDKQRITCVDNTYNMSSTCRIVEPTNYCMMYFRG